MAGIKNRVDTPGVVVREEYVGQAPQVVCYPGVSSCITITCISPGGLCGAHLTVSTEEDLIEDAIRRLASAGARSFTDIYVVGAIGAFKSRTKHKGFNTRKKMASKLRKVFGYTGSVRFFDTSTAALSVNLGVTKNGMAVVFGWQDENAARVSGFTVPDVSSYTTIPAHSFVSM